MRLKHPLENYLIICLFAVVSLLTAYSIVSAVNGNINPQPKPVNVLSTADCSFQDKSFCGTEQLFKALVGRADFSSILENQTPVSITCSGNAQTQMYCKGVKDGLIIQFFRVDQNGHSQLVTRNQYITFFASYFQHHGPFAYTDTIASGTSVLMRYKNHNGSALYTLQFAQEASTWKLAYPSVSAVQSQN